MQQLTAELMKQLSHFYQKAEHFMGEERQFAISEAFLNATLERFVTDNVSWIKEMRMEIHDHWLRLYATIDYSGQYVELSVDLKLLEVDINHQQQLFVFQQLSDTQVIKSDFRAFYYTWLAKGALFYYQDIKQHDPLGMILQRFNIGVTEKNRLLYLDLMRWFKNNKSVLNSLKKVNITHGVLQEKQLVVTGRAFLDEIIPKRQLFPQTKME